MDQDLKVLDLKLMAHNPLDLKLMDLEVKLVLKHMDLALALDLKLLDLKLMDLEVKPQHLLPKPVLQVIKLSQVKLSKF